MIDLGPNEDLMCQMNDHRSVLCSSHLKNHFRSVALLWHTGSDCQGTEIKLINEVNMSNIEYGSKFIYLSAVIKCAKISGIHFGIISATVRVISL